MSYNKSQFFTNPGIGISQFSLPIQRDNKKKSLPILSDLKKKLSHQTISIIESDQSYTEKGPTQSHKLLQQTFDLQKIKQPKSRSLLKRLVESNIQKPLKTLPSKLNTVREENENYKIEDHLQYLTSNSHNLSMLSNKMKTIHQDQFKQNAEKTFDSHSTQKIMTLFRLMQTNTLKYQEDHKPDHHVILKNLEQLHHLQKLGSPKKSSIKRIDEFMKISQAPPSSPSPSKLSEYKTKIRKRLSKYSKQSTLVIQDQLLQPYVARDPLQQKRLQKIKYFFKDLLNNITNIQTEHRGGNQQLMNTCNNQINELLFESKHHINLKLRTNSYQVLFQEYLILDHIDQSHELKEIVEQIEKSVLYKKLNYFNDSLLLFIQKRLINQSSDKLAIKAQLQKNIKVSIIKFDDYHDQSIVNHIKPMSLRIPQRQILKEILKFKQDKGSPLIHLQSLEQFQWEVLDKAISENYELRREMNSKQKNIDL